MIWIIKHYFVNFNVLMQTRYLITLFIISTTIT